ncbi:MAG: phage tail assembly chaperone [Fluviibacter sp.]
MGKELDDNSLVDTPPFPELAIHIWSAFLELHNGRTYGMSGPNPISYDTVYFWCQMTGIVLTPWELGVVKDLDNEYIKAMGEENG